MPDISGTAGKQWYLKIDDGSVFGPVESAVLRDWAEQGRIAPGNELSEDKKTWVPAETIPGLGMEWKVGLRDGTLYGPLNLRTLGDLIREGTVSSDAKLVNVVTKEESSVDQKRDAIFGLAGTPAAAPAPAPAATEIRPAATASKSPAVPRPVEEKVSKPLFAAATPVIPAPVRKEEPAAAPAAVEPKTPAASAPSSDGAKRETERKVTPRPASRVAAPSEPLETTPAAGERPSTATPRRDILTELQQKEQIEQLKKRLARTESTLDQVQRELEYEKARHAYTREEVNQRKAELVSRTELTKKDMEALMSKLRQAEEELEQRTDGFRKRQQESHDREQELEQEVEDLNGKLSESFSQLDVLKAELETEQAISASRQRSARARIRRQAILGSM